MCSSPFSDSSADTCLGCLPVGAKARVGHVEGGDALAQRLVDLGFWEGTEVQLVRRAPLGDPIEYRLRGYRLALRRTEAARVRVIAQSDR